ncbi:MAE_28990/MAE_18760 family HEPN-like nuclease, partial [Phocaeicola dorei]
RIARTKEIIGCISSDIIFADAIGRFNGNVDLRTILNVCKDFKLQLRAIPNKDGVATTLKAVKDARNHLAHGDVSYSNFGSTILLSDIIKYKKDTLDFLSFFINRVEQYISNKEYKK